MKTDQLKDLFKNLDFDIAEPQTDHRKRFEEKLIEQRRKKSHRRLFSLWLPALSVAAAIVLVITVVRYIDPVDAPKSLAAVSPEMEQTQNFYTSVITKELEELKDQRSPETEGVINDALEQMEILEKDYLLLEEELKKSGQDDRVIYAMISNFQKRINLLNLVLDKIKMIKNLKTTPNENKII